MEPEKQVKRRSDAAEKERKQSFLLPISTNWKQHKRSSSATNLPQNRPPVHLDSSYMFEPAPVFGHSLVKRKRNWTAENSIYVKRIGERAGGYRWIHAQAAVYYDRWYNGWGISFIIISALAAAGDIPYVATCQTDLNWIKIVAIVLGFTVSVGFTIQQFKNFGSTSERHRTSEANYDAFYEQIKQELQKNSKDRQDASDYVEWLAKGMIDLKNSRFFFCLVFFFF